MTAKRNGTWTLIATSCGFAVIQLDVSVVNVATKPIATALGGGIAEAQWVVDTYTLALAALLLTAGACGDRIGAKPVFMAGFAVFTAASAACGAAPGLGVLIGARAGQGVGAAMLGACSLALLNHAYPEPLVGGALLTSLGWRSIFFINLPIGVASIWLTARFVPGTEPAGGRSIDLTGQLAAVVGLTLLAGSMIEGGERGFGDPAVLAGLLGGAAVVAGLVLWEARHPAPMLPIGLFRSPGFSTACAIGLLVSVGFYGMVFDLSLYLQRQLGYSPLATGLAFAPTMGAVLVANLAASRMAGTVPRRAVMFGGAVLMLAGYLALLGVAPGTRYPAMAAQLVAIGAGIGLIVPPMTATLLDNVPRARSGIAAGTLNALRQCGSVIGVALLGSILAGAGLRPALLVAAALTAAVAVLSSTTQSARTPRKGLGLCAEEPRSASSGVYVD